jgi:hypothetical protein
MRRAIQRGVLAALCMAASANLLALANNGGGSGGSGGGSWSCRLRCLFTIGSCEIPSGDPNIPNLHDPFCEQRRAACLSACSGGGVFIGAVPAPPAWLAKFD